MFLSESFEVVPCLSTLAKSFTFITKRSKPWWCHQMETFSALLVLCKGNQSPVDSLTKASDRALMFSLICAWTNSWANKQDAGDLRHHYDVIVMNRFILQVLGSQTWFTDKFWLLIQNLKIVHPILNQNKVDRKLASIHQWPHNTVATKKCFWYSISKKMTKQFVLSFVVFCFG